MFAHVLPIVVYLMRKIRPNDDLSDGGQQDARTC